MKAMYEIKFHDKREPIVIKDSRRIAGDATTKGFKKILAWAEGVCEREEFVGSIQMLTCEKP